MSWMLFHLQFREDVHVINFLNLPQHLPVMTLVKFKSDGLLCEYGMPTALFVLSKPFVM